MKSNIGRVNPIIKCRKPDCPNTFTKHPLRNGGAVRWSKVRQYCPIHQHRIGVERIILNRLNRPKLVKTCARCGTHESPSQWHFDKNGNTICNKCHHKEYRMNNQSLIKNNNSRRVAFGDKIVILPSNPRKGQCIQCGEEIFTHIHHAKGYSNSDPLYGTRELCISCHRWRHRKNLLMDCVECGSSNVVRDGLSKYHKDRQRFLCRDCESIWEVPITDLVYHLLNLGLQEPLNELEQKGLFNWVELVRNWMTNKSEQISQRLI